MRVQSATYVRPPAAPKTTLPWDQPVGGYFIYPDSDTVKKTQARAATAAMSRTRFGEKWVTRQVLDNGKPAVRVQRVE